MNKPASIEFPWHKVSLRITRVVMSLVATMLIAFGTASRACATEQVISLFNGKDLSQFYTFLKGRGVDHDPLSVFTVRGGVLRISGEEWGGILTHREYTNYRLITEYKWGQQTSGERIAKARDSGVWVHCIGEDGAWNGFFMYGIEANVIEGGTGDILVVGDGSEAFSATTTVRSTEKGQPKVFDPNGQSITINKGRINWWGRDPQWKDVKGFRGRQDIEKPLGQWNRLECQVLNGHLRVTLNGVLVNEATDVRPTKGKIQIQSEGAEVLFRRIDLIPLDEP